MSRLTILISVLVLCLALAAACDRSADNQCGTFSANSGDFEPCTWKLSQADELCVEMGMKQYWGDLADTICGGADTAYIVTLTCCTK